MKHILVLFLVTYCFSNQVKSDSSSSEEDCAESYDNHIQSNYQLECIDFIKIEEVESCFAAKCKAECVAANIKIAGASQVHSFRKIKITTLLACTRKLQLGMY